MAKLFKIAFIVGLLALNALIPQGLNAQTQAEFSYNKGMAHLSGNGAPFSHYKALECFKEACNLGSQKGCGAYGER
ncbi:MAG: hypothetical protein LBQ52_09955 [Helicobacteraceae bacterium]|nr:hypothetical protein [Helicobacteraceae bacterium]